MERPGFFQAVQDSAAKRWAQLEADPELAAPWHQLFRQVQSPRHVLSELLQNADDAGATETFVRVENSDFVFMHNGHDFSEEHFSSMCRFGYSNKRSLHTIGFRGIGFKSTFSLGDTVELLTPTLSVCFERCRFTEPIWRDYDLNIAQLTRIRVSLRDERIEQEITKNLEDWLKSPLSLLFFRNIRSIRIGDQDLRWESCGAGPTPESEWMALNGDQEKVFLVARSQTESFPEDALAEILQERMLPVDREIEFPPCRVEIVLGARGLYVVLGAGVDTELPFACNAPFIQDPARLKIKDPETSPTNRWLLERAGTFAASVMLGWLHKSSSTVEERSRAYELMPDVNRADRSFQGVCATTVEQSFEIAIANEPILLTDTGELKRSSESVIVPEQLLDVWSGEQISTLFDTAHRPAFSRHVAQRNRQKLINWNALEQISKADVIGILQSRHLPKPDSWKRLLKLWSYVYPETTGYRSAGFNGSLRIVPVQGKEVLYSGSEVVRLGEKRLLASEADWDFLAAHLVVLNPNWPRYLADHRRAVEAQSSDEGLGDLDRALTVLKAIGLDEASDVNKVIGQVTIDFFTDASRQLSECIQIAQIAAKLNVSAAHSFRFATRDMKLRSTDASILYDKDGTLEPLLPGSWISAHLLHEAYCKSFVSCTAEEWHRWVSSGRSGLFTFAPLGPVKKYLFRRSAVEDELRSRGLSGHASYMYKADNFQLEDWDFEDCHWTNWTELAEHDHHIWGRICERLLAQPDRFWSSAKNARMVQSSGRGNSSDVTGEPLPPKWVLRFRELPCLRDTRGFYRKPAELLRRTPETLPLLDVEAFVDTQLDSEAARPLLDLLGVGASPTGPDRLLERLRALSQADKPPVAALERLYRSLDRLIDSCSTEDLLRVRKAFREERIVFTDSGSWSSTQGIFLASDEQDVPGAEIVRSSVRDLSMWHKLGVPNRPTVELAIEWLLQLPSGSRLSPGDGRRVRELLPLYPVRIWDECGHWLNLAGEWAPTRTLTHCLGKQSGFPWNHLHEWVKQKTADLLRLSAETSEALPFSALLSLGSQIEERFQQSPLLSDSPKRCFWLSQLGEDLKRILPKEGETDTEFIRMQASALAETVWQNAPRLELTPYLDGVPAGTPRRAEACWSNGVLYVEDRPMAKLAKVVSRELGRTFGRSEIEDAIKFCFDRPPEFVTEYMEENFRLRPNEIAEVPSYQTSEPSEPEAESPELTPPVSEVNDAQKARGEAGTTALREENGDVKGEVEAADQEWLVEGYAAPQRGTHGQRPPKPGIMERFALGQGFEKDGSDRFYRTDGSWIAKPTGDRYWEWRSVRGEVLRYLYARDHCLEREPLEIDAEVWRMIETHPETHSMILVDREDEPIEITGATICALKDDGVLKLYQTQFRLVCEDVPESFSPLGRQGARKPPGADEA